jgi:hypothetical protein
MVPVAPIITGITLVFTFHIYYYYHDYYYYCYHYHRHYYWCDSGGGAGIVVVVTATGLIPGSSVLQCKRGQNNKYTTVQYNTIQ